MEIWLQHLGGLGGLGVLAAGVGIAYSQFRSGSLKVKDDLISTLKESAVAEKIRADRLASEKATLITSHQEQINQLNNKLGQLQGLYESAEKRNKEMLDILQGVSPEEKQYREDMRAFTKGVAIYMDNSAKVLEKILDHVDGKRKEGGKK